MTLLKIIGILILGALVVAFWPIALAIAVVMVIIMALTPNHGVQK